MYTEEQLRPTAHLPERITYQGRTYMQTGKIATTISDNLPVREYADDADRRLWMGANGELFRD